MHLQAQAAAGSVMVCCIQPCLVPPGGGGKIHQQETAWICRSLFQPTITEIYLCVLSPAVPTAKTVMNKTGRPKQGTSNCPKKGREVTRHLPSYPPNHPTVTSHQTHPLDTPTVRTAVLWGICAAAAATSVDSRSAKSSCVSHQLKAPRLRLWPDISTCKEASSSRSSSANQQQQHTK